MKTGTGNTVLIGGQTSLLLAAAPSILSRQLSNRSGLLLGLPL